jgi:hypothetical protein
VELVEFLGAVDVVVGGVSHRFRRRVCARAVDGDKSTEGRLQPWYPFTVNL